MATTESNTPEGQEFLRGKLLQRESDDDVRPWRALPEYLVLDATKCASASRLSLREFIVTAIQREIDRTKRRIERQVPLKLAKKGER